MRIPTCQLLLLIPATAEWIPVLSIREDRKKDDNLRLALAVGELLSQNGVDVLYTRTDDVYDSPYRKAMIANEAC